MGKGNKANQRCQPIFVRRKADLAGQRQLQPQIRAHRGENQYICITESRKTPKLESPSIAEGRGEVGH